MEALQGHTGDILNKWRHPHIRDDSCIIIKGERKDT